MNVAQRTGGARLGARFWIIAVAALAAVVLTASLGRWQLSRAAQKEALQAAMDERAAQPPVGGSAIAAAAGAATAPAGPPEAAAATADRVQPLLHRTAVLRGHWVTDATVFLDNRQLQGRPGFFVLTPLRLSADPAIAVVVQRGWVPRDFQDRTRLPKVATPAGEVEVTGRIAPPPSRLYEPGGAGAAEGSSRIRQNLDLAAYGAEHRLVLAPLSLWQTGDGGGDDAGPQGLRRDWPAIDSGVAKHYGYAFQWFGLSGLVVILYVWFQIVRRFLRPRGEPSACP